MKHCFKTVCTVATLATALGISLSNTSAVAAENIAVDFNGKYEQNFDQLVRTRGVLAGTWKSGYQQKVEILPGWQAARTGKDADVDIILREMPSPSFSQRLSIFASPKHNDRAFGETNINELTTALGVTLKNTTGAIIEDVRIGYANEVWAAPSRAPGQYVFSYGTSANGISPANYLTHKAMKRLETPAVATVKAGEALDGNARENRTAVSTLLSGLGWKPGELLFLAWTPSQALGSSIGIDDITVIDDKLTPAGFTGEYRQNFDALELSSPVPLPGTAQVNRQQDIPHLPGWQAARIGGSGKSNLGVETSNGGDGGGKLYSFGQTGSKDRALGAVSTQATSLALGTSLTNTSERTFRRVKIKYTTELWRSPSRQIDPLVFSYGTSAEGIGPQNYLTHQAMKKWEQLDARVTTKDMSNTAIDGNATANQQQISSVIEGLEWKPGQTLFMAWTLQNGRGNGSGIGLDNFEMSAE